MTVDFPLADDLLDGWDKALGLDWPGYFSFVASQPWLRDAMAWSYTSLTFLSVLSYLVMALTLDIRRSIYFLETFTLTAVFCTTVGALFPARAAVDRYFGPSADFSAFPLEPGLYHLPSLERLRDGGPVELVVGYLPGLVTFPSFHTAAGVLLVAATWRTPLVVPAFLYVILMIGSTPVFGGHYFVDLIAGAAVALLIAVALARLARFRPVFQTSGQAGISSPTLVPPAAGHRGSGRPCSR
jgi:membrane-associated phospholipid phosphatase